MKVFISYSKEDFYHAERIYNSLCDEGLDPWIDKEKLNPGEYWKPKIANVINQSDFFLLLLSKNSINKRGFFQKEINIALEIIDEMPPYKIFIIPILIDECEPKHDRIKEIHWVKLYPSFDEAIQKICNVIDPKRIKNIKYSHSLENVFEEPNEVENLKLYYKGKFSKKFESFPKLTISFFAHFYSILVDIRLYLYKKKLIKTIKAPGFVISVGLIALNSRELKRITAYIVNLLAVSGLNPTICLRGYPRTEKRRDEITVINENNKSQFGNVNFFYNNCPGAKIIEGTDRYNQCKKANSSFGSNLFVLHDAYQHLKIYRDINIAVVDFSKPFANGDLLPMGLLKEKPNALSRADIIILSRYQHQLQSNEKLNDFRKKYSNKPILIFEHYLSEVLIPNTNQTLSIDELSGKRIGLISNQDSSKNYSALLKHNKIRTIIDIEFTTDYLFDSNSLREIYGKKEELKLDLVVSTEEDWFKIKNFLPYADTFGILMLNTRIAGEDQTFKELILDKIQKY